MSDTHSPQLLDAGIGHISRTSIARPRRPWPSIPRSLLCRTGVRAVETAARNPASAWPPTRGLQSGIIGIRSSRMHYKCALARTFLIAVLPLCYNLLHATLNTYDKVYNQHGRDG